MAVCCFFMQVSVCLWDNAWSNKLMIWYAWAGAPDVYSSCTALHDGGSEGSKSCFISVIKHFVVFPPRALIRPRWPRHDWSAFGVFCCVLSLKRFWRFSGFSHLNSEEAEKVTGFPPSPSRCCAFPLCSSRRTSAANKWDAGSPIHRFTESLLMLYLLLMATERCCNMHHFIWPAFKRLAVAQISVSGRHVSWNVW